MKRSKENFCDGKTKKCKSDEGERVSDVNEREELSGEAHHPNLARVRLIKVRGLCH